MGTKAHSSERCTAFLLFAVMIAAFGGFQYGYHTAIISGALIYLTSTFHLTIAEQGFLVSVILLAALGGALISGELADKIGRKKTIIVTAILFLLGSLISWLSVSYGMLILGRCVSGLGVGIVSLAAPIYLAEVSPPRFRGAFVASYQFAIAFGILISFAVNYLFSLNGDWRWMFLCGVFPALFQMLLLFFLPETPAWLFKRGLHELAVKTLGKLRKDKEWISQVKVMKGSALGPAKEGTWKALLSSKVRYVLLLGIALSAFQQITGINTVIYYAPKIFATAGFNSATGAILATLGIGIINVIATTFSVWLLDKVGRRLLLLLGAAGMALSLGFLSFAFFMKSALIGKIALISLMAYVSFFAIGLGAVTWVIISEIYPMRIRGKAMTIAVFANWFFNYLVSLTFLDLIHSIGSHGAFLLYALISALSFWFIFCYIPETKGKSLEEIESLLIR